MPPEIAGGMPSQCSSDIALEIQCSIEAALLERRPLGGFSLDISKCFKQLPRPPISLLLKHLGMPPQVVDRWMQVLAVSERCPVFQGAMGSSIGATTGAPEGDAMSVVAMCAVCWMLIECNRATESRLLTFVDTFSWLAPHRTSLRKSLRVAREVCGALCLPIDWRKSFSWGTTPDLRRFWDLHAKEDLPAGATLRRVSEATDLGTGFCFQYKRLRGKADVRLDEGKQRLDKLRKQPRPLLSKVRLLLGGIWPQCLFGMHVKVLPRATLDQLRSKASKSLYQTGPSQSPLLVLSSVVEAQADPEVFLLIQSAMAVRRLFVTDPRRAALVLQAACDYEEGSPVLGPATAFAAMFGRNQWEITETGWCMGPGMFSFSDKCGSRRQISRAIQAAWTYELGSKLAHRNGLHNLGAVSGRDTLAVVRSLPASGHPNAVNCISGGHMSASSKAQWDPLQDPCCPFCGHRDTKAHRAYDCPLFGPIRVVFGPLLAWVQEHAPHWIHSSCITEHPDQHVLRLLFRTRPYVSPPPLLSAPQAEGRVLYTDGSCTVPDIADARHASWAVVEDVSVRTPTSCLLAFFQNFKKPLSNFHVVAQGLVPREQTIGRAEVIALLQVCELASREPHVPYSVYVDSTYALNFLENLQPPGIQAMGPATDVDLCEWTGVWFKPPNLSCFKVKSHANLDSMSLEAARHALGNAMADMAAKAARQSDIPLVYHLLDEINVRQKVHRDMLRGYLSFQQQCARAVTNARANSRAAEEHDDDASVGSPQQLRAWPALAPVEFIQVAYPALRDEWLTAAPWPPWYVASLWTWLTLLQWPATSLAPPETAGVSLLELLADYICTTGLAPPLAVSSAMQAAVPLNSAQGKVTAFSAKDMVITLAAAIKYLERVAHFSMILAEPHRRVPCLRTLGCRAARRGFVPRPRLASQESVGQFVIQLVEADNQAELIRVHAAAPLQGAFGLDSEHHQRWESLTEHQRIRIRKRLWCRKPAP